MTSVKGKPTWQGVCLVSGGAIGAGMFALPMVSAAPWIMWSLAGLIIVWLMTFLSCKLLADVNIALANRQEESSANKISFSTITQQVLGSHWAFINNLSITFILMILMSHPQALK